MTEQTQTPPAARGTIGRIKARAMTVRYLIFLLSLMYLFSTPFFWVRSEATEGPATDAQLADYFWGYLDLVITLVSGCFAVSRRWRVLRLSVPLATVAMCLAIGAEATAAPAMLIAGYVTLALFFAFTGAVIVCDIWKAHEVTIDTLLGAVCVYLLIAATWALFYSLVELLSPGSMVLVSGAEADKDLLSARDYPLLLYFSFSTLTSVGYGDLIANSPAARMLSAWEAIVGQFYMAVLVARLVALYITRMPTKAVEAESEPDKTPTPEPQGPTPRA